MSARRTRFWVRRAAQQRWLRAALGAVVLIVVAAMSVAVGAAVRQPDVAVREALRTASADDGSMVWERTASDHTAAQDTATRAQIRRAVGRAPITISSSAVGNAETGSHTLLPLRDDASLRAATSGLPALPRGAIAIEDVGARALGVGVGDTLSVQMPEGIRTLRIVALWHVDDPRAPLWNGIGPGTSGAIARVALSASELAAGGVTLTARWSIAPDPDLTRAADLPALLDGFARLRAAALASDSLAELDGNGEETILALRDGLAAVGAVVPVACALVAASALLALLLLTRLLAEVRIDETALLRARGASRGQIASGDLRAALLPVLAAAGAGAVVAQLLLLRIATPPGWVEMVLPAVLSAVGALVVVLGVGFVATADRSGGRGLRVTGIVAAGLLAVIAAVGVLRLLTTGVGADPAADLAPGLVIATLVVAGLLAGPTVATAAVAVAQRRPGLPAALATRRVRNRPGLVAGALVLVALSIGSAGFAATTIATARDFLHDAGRLVTGGDLDVRIAGFGTLERGGSASDATATARAARARAVAPAIVEPVTLGGVSTTLAAAPTERIGTLQAGRLGDVAALAPAVGAPVGLPVNGAGTLRVGLEVTAPSASAGLRVRVTAWIVRPGTGAERIDLPGVGIGTQEVAARIPGTGDGRLVALDAAVSGAAGVDGLAVRIRSLARVDGGGTHPLPLPSDDWALTSGGTGVPGITASGARGWTVPGIPTTESGTIPLGRVMPPGSPDVPVVISRALASALGLAVGGRAAADTATNLQVTVAAIVPHTIGARDATGVWADLPTLQTALLRTDAAPPRADHVWLAVRDADRAAARISARDPRATVTGSPAVLLAPLALPVTIGVIAAALGTAVLALLGIAAVVASVLRARRPEIAMLRALGAGRDVQRVAGRIELVGVLGYAIVVGLIAAIAGVLLTVPPIAHALAPGVAPDVPAPIGLDPVVLGDALAVLLVGALIAVIVQERRVDVLATRPGGEAER